MSYAKSLLRVGLFHQFKEEFGTALLPITYRNQKKKEMVESNQQVLRESGWLSESREAMGTMIEPYIRLLEPFRHWYVI